MGTSGSDIAGFSPWIYMPLITPAWMASIDLDDGQARIRIELGAP